MTSRPQDPIRTPPRSLLTQWARLLLDSFAEAQVRHVVISPGSRSTPFVAAALANPSLHCTTLIDERSAAFYALGLAKATGEPTLLICTSGTAGANYFPAVVEAAMSYAPLLVLTADRPLELDQCHASQTIDQTKLYSSHARAFFDLGTPEGSMASLRALRRKAAQAASLSKFPLPGPVHLNARARKPLEPARDQDSPLGNLEKPPGLQSVDSFEKRVEALKAQPLVGTERPVLSPSSESLERLAQAIRSQERGLIVCGPAPAYQPGLSPSLSQIARQAGYPLLVEAASQQRYFRPEDDMATRIGSIDSLSRCSSLRHHLEPQLIIQIGTPPVSTGWNQYMEAHLHCDRFVVAAHGWNDPWNSATWMIQAEPQAVFEGLVEKLAAWQPRTTSLWLENWQTAEDLAWEAAKKALESSAVSPESLPREGLPRKGPALTEGSIPRMVVEALPPGAVLALGNSLPIRQLDAFSPPQDKALRVWTQRGAAGIDGVGAGAAGFARALDRPGALLIGDVSFLHGIADLQALRLLQTPMAVVIINNDGGRIFEQLPIARTPLENLPHFAPAHLDSWFTPHGQHLRPVAELHDLPYHQVSTEDSLRQALDEAFATDGASLIEAQVPPHGAFEQNQHLWRDLEDRLSEQWARITAKTECRSQREDAVRM